MPNNSLLFSFKVKWLEQQVVKKRVKRDRYYTSSQNFNRNFNDPKWKDMWYLVSLHQHWMLLGGKKLNKFCELTLFGRNQTPRIGTFSIASCFIIKVNANQFKYIEIVCGGQFSWNFSFLKVCWDNILWICYYVTMINKKCTAWFFENVILVYLWNLLWNLHVYKWFHSRYFKKLSPKWQ